MAIKLWKSKQERDAAHLGLSKSHRDVHAYIELRHDCLDGLVR